MTVILLRNLIFTNPLSQHTPTGKFRKQLLLLTGFTHISAVLAYTHGRIFAKVKMAIVCTFMIHDLAVGNLS